MSRSGTRTHASSRKHVCVQNSRGSGQAPWPSSGLEDTHSRVVFSRSFCIFGTWRTCLFVNRKTPDCDSQMTSLQHHTTCLRCFQRRLFPPSSFSSCGPSLHLAETKTAHSLPKNFRKHEPCVCVCVCVCVYVRACVCVCVCVCDKTISPDLFTQSSVKSQQGDIILAEILFLRFDVASIERLIAHQHKATQ